jgi:hypothetical protein
MPEIINGKGDGEDIPAGEQGQTATRRTRQ